MTVKASRFLTHIKRLKEPEDAVRRFLEAAVGLGGKLGPVLIQLPPDLACDSGRLKDTLTAFPRETLLACEFRHDSWFNDEVYALLADRDACLVWADRREASLVPEIRTSSWAYLRLHEGTDHPPGYRQRTLRRWADALAASWTGDEERFVYFNNDPRCCAVRDASLFARINEDIGISTTRTPMLAAS